ncbi:putative ABC transport system permease protein [Amphritea atlantica]|uniref:Putative ABC transport system permease protein n=1 Tax=Amphritea atlantica TaxID=355243 RepID=A0A1H9ECL4_9GAMM|nr:ABC transporter permease [Amphritea atlantica]SEQ23506.1 putative ABC transport system permease protein [Amphritea atlantica]
MAGLADLSPLDRKLLRDLWRMKGQAVAIALVIALGVLMLVMMNGLVRSLEDTRTAYYERHRLAQVFAPLQRAPQSLLSRVAEIEGVSVAVGRVTGSALINLPGQRLPLSAQAVSLPDQGDARLNDIYLTAGRRPDPSHKDEIILLQDFAKAHSLSPGDPLSATMHGARRTFRIVGLAQAPEFLYSAAPGEFVPDDARFAVIWMSQSALAAVYDMQGAFNQLLLGTTKNSSLPAILDRVDVLLQPYGGRGAYGLADHVSNRFIEEEISGLRVSSRTVPPIFLAVAAFLLNIVISRMIRAERSQIGLLKAFGYRDIEISLHYLKFVIVIAVSGALLGCFLGVMSGRSLAQVYQHYYKFPFLLFQVDPMTFVIGILVSILAAAAGGMLVLRSVFRLSPAVAMQPPTPADYSRSLALAAFMKRWLDQPGRMVARRLLRQPGRAAGGVIGIAAGMSLAVAMLNVMSAFDQTLALSFNLIDRSDLSVSFIEPLSDNVVFELQSIDGVIEVEAQRTVAVKFSNGQHSYRGAITGLPVNARLNRALDNRQQAIPMRTRGVVLGSALADILRVKTGDVLDIDVREGRQPQLQIPVTGVADTLIGSPAYMALDSLNRVLAEPRRVSGAYLRIDSARQDAIYRRIKALPGIAGVSLKQDAREAFQRLIDSSAGAVRYLMAAIAAVITFGIVYNSARIAFAERARDLASLRVIGFTRREAAFVLLAELGIITLLALPLGGLLGYFLVFAISEGFSTDLYRVSAVFVPQSYGIAALAVIIAALLSGWLVKRDIDRIDLVSALKVRE